MFCLSIFGYIPYSYSMVAGGFGVTSYTTLATLGISEVMREATMPSTSYGISIGSAVIPSLEFTARTEMIHP